MSGLGSKVKAALLGLLLVTGIVLASDQVEVYNPTFFGVVKATSLADAADAAGTWYGCGNRKAVTVNPRLNTSSATANLWVFFARTDTTWDPASCQTVTLAHCSGNPVNPKTGLYFCEPVEINTQGYPFFAVQVASLSTGTVQVAAIAH